MAITVNDRPRIIYYYTPDSPAVAVYSTWNAAWNPVVYIFNVLTADVLSGIQLRIYEVGTNTLLAENFVRPFRAGTWNVDIAPFIRDYLFSVYSTDFTNGDNCADAGNSLRFYITYTQIFDNGDTSLFSSEEARPIEIICAAKQFGDQYGENMAQYTPFMFDLEEGLKAKFLTAFQKPTLFKGYPLTLSFIYSQALIGVQVIKSQKEQNVNGSLLIQNDTDLDPNTVGRVNYLLVTEPAQQYADSIKLSLRTGEAIPNYYVDPGYVDEGYQQIL